MSDYEGRTMWYAYYPNSNTSVIHQWATDGERVFSLEQCQRDQMKEDVAASEEEAEELLSKAGYTRCSYCWPLDGPENVTNADVTLDTTSAIPTEARLDTEPDA